VLIDSPLILKPVPLIPSASIVILGVVVVVVVVQ